MIPATLLQIVEPTHASDGRRAALRLASQMNFDESSQGKLALVVTEIATNLIKHARGGRLLLSPVSDSNGQPGIDVFGLDQGPGMSNFSECLRDGYSTAGSPGTGLGAIVRLSAESDVFTLPGKGTVIRARCLPAARAAQGQTSQFEVGGVVVPIAGESESGDSWSVRRNQDSIALLAVDGLRHGTFAAEAAREAVRVFQSKQELVGVQLMEEIHTALRGTRGAAVAVVEILPARGQLFCTGVGNIAGVICKGSAAHHLVSMTGIVGHRIHKIRQFEYSWSAESILVMHSDGIRTRWNLEDYRGLQSKSPALIAGVLIGDAGRGTDDASVVVACQRGARNVA